MNPPLCECGKDSHTYDGAKRVIKKMTWTARRKGKSIRSQSVYRCEKGRTWHITSHSYTEHVYIYTTRDHKQEMSN
jgi:hypothetical protein